MEVREFLNEGKGYIEQGNPVQASEKLYKAAEEVVKGLAPTYADSVWKEVEEKGRRRYWDTAWFLHVEGFHEGRLDISLVKERVGDIEELVKLADENC